MTLLHPVRRCYEDSGWTDEDSDCDRRSSDTMQCRILQPERFRVTVALTVLRGSVIYMYNYFSCDTTYFASRGIFALWLQLSAWLSVVPGFSQCSFMCPWKSFITVLHWISMTITEHPAFLCESRLGDLPLIHCGCCCWCCNY